MNTQAIIDLVKAKGGNPHDFRDAVHEAVHGLQLGTSDWSRRNLVLAFEDFDLSEDLQLLFDWECQARATEWLACERAGIPYDLNNWAAIASLESAKQGHPFQMEHFLKGIPKAKEKDAPRLLEQIVSLLETSSPRTA